MIDAKKYIVPEKLRDGWIVKRYIALDLWIVQSGWWMDGYMDSTR